ncbi:MAG: aminopeptidase P family protein [Oscillospiraceae bacterium]
MNHFKQIAQKLPEYHIDAMMINSAPGEFYAAGFHGEGIAIVTADETYYFTDSRYIEAANKEIAGATIRMTDRNRNYKAMVNEVIEARGIKTLGFEENYMTVSQHEDFVPALHATLVPAGKLISALRAAKDEGEIELLIKAQRISEKAFDEILKFIKVGMTEKEVAAKLVYDMLRFGAEKMSFDPIVVTGPNGSLPHGIPGDRKIENGSFVTMDFGCMYGGYCSDMTRTIAVGEPTDEMKTVYETVLKAQLAGIAVSKAGVPGIEIDGAARKVIEDAGYGDYFGHGYGHSVGIEIHESPNANTSDKTPMPVNAAVSAEPGIYLPGRFGVRIEDVVIMREGTAEVITKAPKNLIIL